MRLAICTDLAIRIVIFVSYDLIYNVKLHLQNSDQFHPHLINLFFKFSYSNVIKHFKKILVLINNQSILIDYQSYFQVFHFDMMTKISFTKT